MMIYLVTVEGVYDHGTVGVYSSREAAEARASVLWANSDAYHNLRVDEIALDADVAPAVRLGEAGVVRPRYPRSAVADAHFVAWSTRN